MFLLVKGAQPDLPTRNGLHFVLVVALDWYLLSIFLFLKIVFGHLALLDYKLEVFEKKGTAKRGLFVVHCSHAPPKVLNSSFFI